MFDAYVRSALPRSQPYFFNKAVKLTITVSGGGSLIYPVGEQEAVVFADER